MKGVMNLKIIIIAVLATGLLMGLDAGAATLRKTDGRELTGTRIKWFETRREYQVENSDGSMIPVALDDVESVEVDKPAEFDKAVQAMSAKQYDVAIPLLQDLVDRFKRLQWDSKSRELLANAYFAKGDYKKAAQVLSDLLQETPKGQVTDDQRGMYWTALMGAQMTAVLKKELNEALAGESRSLACLAMVRRGDLFKAEGKREDALLDYLRAVMLYEDARENHAEALFKAAQVLDEMRDPRADDLRKRLMSQYPDSVYAKKLGGQM